MFPMIVLENEISLAVFLYKNWNFSEQYVTILCKELVFTQFW